MRLNQSTSNTASESGVSKALLRASSCAVVSWKKRRFAAPVRASVLARFFSSSCRLCSSVMSLLIYFAAQGVFFCYLGIVVYYNRRMHSLDAVHTVPSGQGGE